MFLRIKQLFLATSINALLFLFLIIGIQNSTNKSRVNLFSKKTVELPISFIIGTSFICGSIFGSISTVFYFHKNERDS